MAVQDDTVSLSVLEAESVSLSKEQGEVIPCAFEDVCNVVMDHDYLPTTSSVLVDNAVVYIAGWVVKKVLSKLTCDTCRCSLVSNAVPTSFADSYHLLQLRNNGGLVIPSPGTVRVITIAERYIRRMTNIRSASHQIKASQIKHLVKAEVGSEDIFQLGQHINDTRNGIDNHHFELLSLIVHGFHKLRQYHIGKLHTSGLQRGNMRKVHCKNLHFKGH